MSILKDKKNKIMVRPEEKTDITTKRPYDLWTDMDQLFDNFRTELDSLFWPWGQGGQLTTIAQKRTPPMDIADMGTHYEMKLEMPGIPKDKINIQATPNGIEVKAEHDENKVEKGKNWLRRECYSTSFYRALELPEEVNTENIDAELKDGILKLKLPKVEPKPEHKAKKVQIK